MLDRSRAVLRRTACVVSLAGIAAAAAYLTACGTSAESVGASASASALSDKSDKPASSAPAAWSTSYVADIEDTGMGGTEFRWLVPFGKKLYGGIGYWSDSEGQKSAGAPPGAQVLVLDSPSAAWRVETDQADVLTAATFAGSPGQRKYFAIASLAALTVTTDGKGTALETPALLLLAGMWSRDLGIDIIARSAADPTWRLTTLDPAAGNVRSFAHHVDSVTGVDVVLAGSCSNGSNPSVQEDSALMYPATLDRTTRTLVWQSQPEPWEGDAPLSGYRVMSFTEANGALFATVGPHLYQRIDGPNASWRRVFTATFPANLNIAANGGLRGLHAIPAPDGNGQSLLIAAGGPTARMIRIDPNDGYAHTDERSIVDLLSNRWHTTVHGALFAYNDMLEVTDPKTGDADLVMGLEAYIQAGDTTPQPLPMWKTRFFAGAHYLVRHPDATYEVFVAEDPTLADPPVRVSTRTMALSPFDGTTVYAGGFDANSKKVHNTAWALSAPLATVLAGTVE